MVQQLLLKSQFQAVLKNYRPSDSAIEKLSKTKIALFNGPTASGRNTIMERLVATQKYQQIVSDTTRHPRENNGVLEQSGVEYWFKTEEELLAGLKAGKYIEAAIIHDQQVSGVSVKEIERAAEQHKIAVNDIQPEGVEAFKMYKSDTICIFVIPPDIKTWLARLSRRGGMSAVERERRIASCQTELEHALSADYYHFVINNNLEDVVSEVDSICQHPELHTTSAKTSRVANTLLDDVRVYLSK